MLLKLSNHLGIHLQLLFICFLVEHSSEFWRLVRLDRFVEQSFAAQHRLNQLVGVGQLSSGIHIAVNTTASVQNPLAKVPRDLEELRAVLWVDQLACVGA